MAEQQTLPDKWYPVWCRMGGGSHIHYRARQDEWDILCKVRCSQESPEISAQERWWCVQGQGWRQGYGKLNASKIDGVLI